MGSALLLSTSSSPTASALRRAAACFGGGISCQQAPSLPFSTLNSCTQWPFSLSSDKAKQAPLDYPAPLPTTAVPPQPESTKTVQDPAGTAAATGERGQPQRGDESAAANPTPRAEEQHISQPGMDEINTLLRHPALYDPILKPRHPIVLCHGLYGFDVRGPAFFRLHYWGDLLKILRGKIGAEVFVTSVPGTGAIKDRARVLHEALEATEGVRGRDLNFLAHSMGGLDARYLFSKIRPETYNPRSLTTLSTPHGGSEFMSWCRVNIGIGTDFDKASEAAARLAHEDVNVLPYSLKAPVLSRAQNQAAKDAAAQKRKNVEKAADEIKKGIKEETSALGGLVGSLPSSLTTSVSGYLLDLLDSPAYANLTPSFLREVFNPQTPDRPDIRYFSVAARTEKISIWHPLWLPKVVLDGAEQARAAQGQPAPPRYKGNDGLVNIESAKWGEFLGTLEGCDHWELRGSSGLVNAVASAKAVAEATNIASSEYPDKAKEAVEVKNWWSWQDLYALVGAGSGKKPEAKKQVRLDVEVNDPDGKGKKAREADSSQLADIATWIVKALPGTMGDQTKKPTETASSSSAASSAITSNPSGSSSSSPASTVPDASSPVPQSAKSSSSLPPSSRSTPSSPTTAGSGSAAHSARMLYGVPAASAKPPPSAKPEKFDLERLSLALCRKLYNEGL